MQEPEGGYLLCGAMGSQQLYERDDQAASELVKASSMYTLEYRWFHVADNTDIYTFENLIKDYGTVVHLKVCPDCPCGTDTTP